MKKSIALIICLSLVLISPATAWALDLNLGKCTANLSSAVSNNYSVSWYNFYSPYSSSSYALQEPPSVLAKTAENAIYIKMDYQLRDDSMVKGKSQAANMAVSHWDPSSYTWISEGSVGQSKGSATYGRYNLTGTLNKQSWWGSSSRAEKYQIKAEAKSGDTSTKYRYFWVVRTPSNTSASYQAAPRWLVSRYDRSALYKELSKNWQQIGTAPNDNAFNVGMDSIIELSRGFVNPTKQDLAVEIGLDSLGIINTLWTASNVASECIDSAGIIYQGYQWVSTANSLLNDGLKNSIYNATAPTMTRDAASSASALSSSLSTLANAQRDEANALQAVLYSGGSVYTWEQKLEAEKTAITNAITAVGNARTSISSSLAVYDAYKNLPYGTGAGLYNSAQTVKTNLNQYLNGVENQLKFDQAVINKACTL